VLWKWDGTGPAPLFQVGGTGRVIASPDRIIIISDGIDPQVLISDIGGEVFARPVELDLVLQVTAWVEFNGRIVPLSAGGEMYSSLELDRASLRDEMASVRMELIQVLDGIATEVRRTSNLEHLLMEEFEKVRASIYTADTEIKELSKVTARMHSELEILRTTQTEISKDHTEETERLSTELNILRTGASAADTEITQLRSQLETEKKGRRELEESWSWRMTAPARFFLGMFGRNRVR
jgi:hypothetical protein